MAFKQVSEALKPASEGKVVQLRGWVHRIRKHKDKVFVVLRDSSNIIQAVAKEGTKAFGEAEKLTVESSLEISGKVRADERAPGGYELDAIQITPIHIAETFPIAKDLSEEFLLDVRHLWIRSQKMQAILKVRSKVFEAIHEFYHARGFYEFQSPILTPAAGEEGSTQFEVNYFGKKVYLAQTWQLYAEAAIMSLEKIYCIAPSFRAERSKTSKHLTEYWHAEVEAAWMDLTALAELAEGVLSHICQKVGKECEAELKILGRDPKDLLRITAPFPRITYTEAIDLLHKDGKKVKWGKDLRTLEEKSLVKHYDKPLIVTRYPSEIKAFYMPNDPENGKVVLCMDVLAPEIGVEIIGGSVRDTDLNRIKKKLKDKGEKAENYEWYLDARRYGSIPHAGFGMGVERVIMWICKLDSIRDAIPFPRTLRRTYP